MPDDLETAQAEIRHLRDVLAAIVQGIVCSGSGPVAPCFDIHDRTVEAARGAWAVVDRKPIDDAIRIVYSSGR